MVNLRRFHAGWWLIAAVMLAVCGTRDLAGQEIVQLAKDTRVAEAGYYRIVTLPLPAGVQCEAGQMVFLPGDRLAISTRTGDIFIGEGVYNEPPEIKWTQFASGLHEVLGMAYRDGWIYAVQRPEVTRLKDTDGDGRADLFECFCDDWVIDGNYHEYAFGSKFDREGNLWVALCLTGSNLGTNPFRGWAMRITPDGQAIPTCSGLRSPGGIGFNAAGEVFYTDNQGNWNGTGPLRQLIPGEFEGNPESLRWYDDPLTRDRVHATGMVRPETPRAGTRLYDEAKHIPLLHPPAVYFPYKKMGQSATAILTDETGGKFGPFAGQMFVCDLTHSSVMRICLEKVAGRYQGACFPFRFGFASGNLAAEYGRDGSLFVYGTDRGWGCLGGKPFALQRLIWTGQVPFEIREMHARPDGFELTFTQPVDPVCFEAEGACQFQTYTYIYQPSYGSPEVDKTVPTLRKVVVAPDGLSARLSIDGLVPGHVHEMHFPGVHSATGAPLLHEAAYYTLNALPVD